MRTDISFFGAARNRVLVIIGVIALSLWMLYPIQDSLKLGIDLNGGVQLVLRVKTDDALRLQTQAAAERLRTTLTEARVAFSSVEVASATEFRVDGIGDESALTRAAETSAPMYERTAADGTPHVPPAAGGCRRPARRHRRAGASHNRPQGQRTGRRRAGDRALHGRRSDPGAAARSLRGRKREADDQVNGAAAVDAGRSRTVRGPRSGAPRLQQRAAVEPGDSAVSAEPH